MMKKVFLAAMFAALLTSVGFAAGPTTATGGPVTLSAIIPAYIGFGSPNVSSVTFDYTNMGIDVAMGQPITKLASADPSWTLIYNLAGKPTITVCAYASDLTGTLGGTIQGSQLYASPNGAGSVQFNGSGCGQANAVTMETIPDATSSIGRTESLKQLFMQTPSGTVVAPDTYTGTLSIVAQAQ